MRKRPGKTTSYAMTTFFMTLALIHVAGLFIMMFALRKAPVAIETVNGLQVVSEETAHEAMAAMAAKNAV